MLYSEIPNFEKPRVKGHDGIFLYGKLKSSNGFPISCNPAGRPFFIPTGSDNPGRPARLTGTVYTSTRYIAIGSSAFSPRANGRVGLTGPAITSTFLNYTNISFPRFNNLSLWLLLK